MVEKMAEAKHSSLLKKFITYGPKKFYNIGPRVEVTDTDEHSSLLWYKLITSIKKFIVSLVGWLREIVVVKLVPFYLKIRRIQFYSE